MKLIVNILFLLIPCIAFAQNYQGMSEKDMQKMMEQMQKMQTCMQDVNQSRLQEFEQRAKKTEDEVSSLCASGKRDEAQKKAMDFGLEVAADPDMKKMMECGKMMSSAMPKMPYMKQAIEPDNESKHVCDQ